MLVRDIIIRAATLYNDLEYVRVPKETYLKFLDDAISQVITTRNDAHVKTDIVKLIPGSRQFLPEDALALIDIPRCVIYTYDENGEVVESKTKSKPVVLIEKKDLDYFDNWFENNKGKNYISEYAYSVDTPKMFWVSPVVQRTTVNVELDYSYPHIKFGDSSFDIAMEEEIDLVDSFSAPLVQYMLFLLYSTDSSSQLDKEIAASYLSAFYQQLNVDKTAVDMVKPTVSEPTVLPSTSAAR